MAQRTIDPYAELGVPRDATAQRVAEAYRRLAKRFHPDLHPDATASERMRRLNQAWHILSNPVRRARYDRGGSSARTGTAGHWPASSRVRPAAPAWSGTGAAWRTTQGTWRATGAPGATAQSATPGWQRAARTVPRQRSLGDSGWVALLVAAAWMLLLVAAIYAGS